METLDHGCMLAIAERKLALAMALGDENLLLNCEQVLRSGGYVGEQTGRDEETGRDDDREGDGGILWGDPGLLELLRREVQDIFEVAEIA